MTLDELKAQGKQNVSDLEHALDLVMDVIWSGDSNMTETEKQQLQAAMNLQEPLKMFIESYKKANQEAFNE